MNKLLITVVMVFSISMWAQSRVITGHVGGVSATDSSLIGVIIQEKGTSNAAESDEAGNFSITVSDTGNVVLLVNYEGYKQKEIAVGNQTEVNIALEEDLVVMEEVVIVGYGTVKKSDNTGAVSSLKPEEINKVQSSNVMESVQGKVAGVDITRNSGAAGAKPMVTIRGNRSISAGNDPLYIVDGMQYSNIEDINSNDIASMEVLKDASSTAIYGSRGANGVVIITTKKGKHDPAHNRLRIFFNTYIGTSSAYKFPKALSGQDFVNLKRESFRNPTNGTLPNDSLVIFQARDEYKYVKNGVFTGYVSELLHRGAQHNINFGVSGGNEKLRSYFSVDFFNEKGVLKLDNMKRYTTRLNLDYDVNKYLKVGTQTQVTHYEQSRRFNPMG
ncbi:MAG TPA: TonB-dependent receptor plug domain-containing protein, partial [Cytophagales bacterium]|nr:TonB-dependent receptor plug domain-containing protein [Cytophagales bacterium]